jgi:hypothetical protein
VECIDHGDTVTHCFPATDLEDSIEVAEAIRMAEILLVKCQLRLSAMIGWFEDNLQPHEGTVPEFEVGVGEHDEGALSNPRLASERRDEHAAIDKYADHPRYRADPPLVSSSTFLISSRERTLTPDASALSLIERRRWPNLEISGGNADRLRFPFPPKGLFMTARGAPLLNL